MGNAVKILLPFPIFPSSLTGHLRKVIRAPLHPSSNNLALCETDFTLKSV